MSAIDIFVIVSGSFSVLAALPLIYLALGAVRDARDLRTIQYELAGLMRETKELGEEVRELQREIHRDQQAAKSGIEETRRTVEQVTEAVEQVGSVVGHVSEAVQQVQAGAGRWRLLLRRLVPLGRES
jgi:methyl-accepting chemotaxis protein